ncbi:MAG: lytic transglycosylase domain-containing protein [Campylobacterota bacterium]|nr:lytic transglycosylase domain-containing protein [Campylobacterota bacterium]
MKTLLLFIFTISLFASPEKQISMNWLQQQPKSYAKDFYIWRYLKQNITPSQANNALSQVRYLNNKILYRYINKSDDKNLIDYKKCKKSKTKNLLDKKAYCIEAGLSIYDATKLSKSNLKKVIAKMRPQYNQFSKKLDILNSAIPFKTLEQSEPKVFFDTFNMTGGLYRVKHFNQYFPLSLFKKLKQEKYKKQFSQTIKLIVTNLNMRKAQISLLNLSPEGLNFKSVFHLAINAIRHKKEDLALVYLEDAFNKAYFQMEKNNITFWQYQLTNDKKYLDMLANSWDTNIYTLYANDILKKKQNNIIYNIKQNKDGKLKFDKSNPFQWLKVLKDSKKMDDKKLLNYTNLFNENETLGHLAFVKERYDRYRNSYFVTPYDKYLGKLAENRQALIYAIGRQESRFIPTSISTAYAMGTMQIMPFLSKAIAKELKEAYNIDDQLKAKVNLRYANHHLNYLDRKLTHPLFIAYAYNGGIGFTKRLLKTKLFKKGKYEPFLSMELLPYDETKKYGKKVLTNYFIYQNHLNKANQISFNSLIKSVKNL